MHVPGQAGAPVSLSHAEGLGIAVRSARSEAVARGARPSCVRAGRGSQDALLAGRLADTEGAMGIRKVACGVGLAMLVVAMAGGARAQAVPPSRVVQGVAGVTAEGTAMCVVIVSSDDDDPFGAAKMAPGKGEGGAATALRGCVLDAGENDGDKSGTLYMEPSGGKCGPGEKAGVIVVSSEDDDWEDAMARSGGKPTGECALVLTAIEGSGGGSGGAGLFEAVGIDGARVYILDEDDRIE